MIWIALMYCLASFYTVFQSIFSAKHAVIFKKANAKPAFQQSTDAFVWIFSQNALAGRNGAFNSCQKQCRKFAQKKRFFIGLGSPHTSISIFIKGDSTHGFCFLKIDMLLKLHAVDFNIVSSFSTTTLHWTLKCSFGKANLYWMPKR